MVTNPKALFEFFSNAGIEFYTGVPDSLLKDFTGYLFDHVEEKNHVITANEGSAIALATGIFLATGKPALVYMQNSGIGNAINPLLSLADPDIYSIPMILMIGWRGIPGIDDEPQHIKQGRIQNDLLKAIEIPYLIIGPDTINFESIIQDLVTAAFHRSGPVALIVQNGSFSQYDAQILQKGQSASLMTREFALTKVIETLDESDIVVSTTGMTSREVFEIRVKTGSGHHHDFLVVGSMGHCSQIALGIALKVPKRSVYCLDGDGAFIMHMGSVAIIGQIAPPNLKHIVINNASFDSVGGQPTAASVTNLANVALACGYPSTCCVNTEEDLIEALSRLKRERGPILLEIQVKPGFRSNLKRPNRTPLEYRFDFERNLHGD